MRLGMRFLRRITPGAMRIEHGQLHGGLHPPFFIKVWPHDQSQRAPDVTLVGGNESGRRDDYGDPIPVIRTSNSLERRMKV